MNTIDFDVFYKQFSNRRIKEMSFISHLKLLMWNTILAITSEKENLFGSVSVISRMAVPLIRQISWW